jgi:hypothetical protein
MPYGPWKQTTQCDFCENGEHVFDVEGPDYEVGLMGYSVFYYTDDIDENHDEDCEVRTYTPEQISKLEYKLAIKVADGAFDSYGD